MGRDRDIRTIVKVDTNGKILKTYKTSNALKVDNLVYNNVYRCAKGIRNTYKGYRFVFEDEYKDTDFTRDDILCLNDLGEVVKSYERLEDVKFDGFWPSKVCECINLTKSKTRHHKGHYWCYRNNLENTIKEIEKNFILQYQDGELISIYPNVVKAGKEGYDKKAIYQCLNGVALTHAGCVWKRNY